MVKLNGGADGKYVCNHVLCQFGDVIPFLQNHPELPATSGKLLHLLTDPQKSAYLRVELAAVIDCGERFVKATYNLEGDGPLVFQCYDIIAAFPLFTLLPQLGSCGCFSLKPTYSALGKLCKVMCEVGP